MTEIAAAQFLLDLLAEMLETNISRANDLTHAQSIFLFRLSKAGPMSMTDVSKALGHSTAAATGFVGRLEKLGYVERRHLEEDRRKVTVMLTRKGLDFVNKTRKQLEALAAPVRTATTPALALHAVPEQPPGTVIRALQILTAAA